jgi:hypothetical protein
METSANACDIVRKDDITSSAIVGNLSINHKLGDIWFSGKYEILQYEEQPQYVVLSALMKRTIDRTLFTVLCIPQCRIFHLMASNFLI